MRKPMSKQVMTLLVAGVALITGPVLAEAEGDVSVMAGTAPSPDEVIMPTEPGLGTTDPTLGTPEMAPETKVDNAETPVSGITITKTSAPEGSLALPEPGPVLTDPAGDAALGSENTATAGEGTAAVPGAAAADAGNPERNEKSEPAAGDSAEAAADATPPAEPPAAQTAAESTPAGKDSGAGSVVTPVEVAVPETVAAPESSAQVAVPLPPTPQLVVEAAPRPVMKHPFKSCPSGKQWRVGVVEDGPLTEYQHLFSAMTLALSASKGIGVELNLPAGFAFDRSSNWEQLSAITAQECFRFAPDGIYNGNWDPRLRDENFKRLGERIRTGGDLDLLVVFGSHVAGDLNLPEGAPPVLVVSGADPLLDAWAGDGEFSNRPGFFMERNPQSILDEILLFHELFDFTHLGFVGNVEAEVLAKLKPQLLEQGIEMSYCHVTPDGSGNPDPSYRECVKKLSQTSEAVFLGAEYRNLPELRTALSPLYARHIPTFSHQGGTEVEYGAMLATARIDVRERGRFIADTLGKIASGSAPETIPGFFRAPIRLAINLESGIRCGWEPTLEVLSRADQIFPEIRGAMR